MNISPKNSAKIAYTLRYDNENGEIIEQITAENPLSVTIGNNDLLEKFEKNIIGLKAGDKFAFALAPEDAYGNYDEEGIISVPKAELLQDIENEDVEIMEGMIVPIVTDDNEDMEAVVLEVDGDIITLDFNHPLAGETLFFSGSVVSIENQ